MKRRRVNVKKTIRKKIELSGKQMVERNKPRKSKRKPVKIEKSIKKKADVVRINKTSTIKRGSKIKPVSIKKKNVGLPKPKFKKERVKSGVDRDKQRLAVSKTPTVSPQKGGSKSLKVNLISDRNHLRFYGDEIKFGEYKPILEKKEPISIIITAYQTQNYIEDCLDSIENQTYFKNNDNYEILVGIDGCQETLNRLLNIRHKYRNLRIFMMDSNKGTYVTRNTLIDLVFNDNIFFFDSDDIMLPQMINEVLYYADDYDTIRFNFFNLNGKKLGYNRNSSFSRGVFFIKRNSLERFGGFEPWLCSADSELYERTKGFLNQKILSKELFKRRIHSDSLSGSASKVREKRRTYRSTIQHKKPYNSNTIFVNKKTNTFQEK